MTAQKRYEIQLWMKREIKLQLGEYSTRLSNRRDISDIINKKDKNIHGDESVVKIAASYEVESKYHS